jgi:hypothetical protein
LGWHVTPDFFSHAVQLEEGVLGSTHSADEPPLLDPELEPEEPELEPEEPELEPEDPELEPEYPELDPEYPELDPE